ncbi:hypothetical protein B6U91_01425 [Candidatus Pacearchaeota archaeon ex4484_71]|nr:MAG: hypothetical protein B6U91_01425 [Candidatus Pacearchaeota archaeon ex4484_71]
MGKSHNIPENKKKTGEVDYFVCLSCGKKFLLGSEEYSKLSSLQRSESGFVNGFCPSCGSGAVKAG